MDQIKAEAFDFLQKNHTAVIATAHDGELYASAVHYIIDEDWNFYFLSHRNTKKYLNISAKQKASIVVGVGPKHISVQARGIADLFVSEDSKKIVEKFKWIKGSHVIEHWPVEEMAKFEGAEPVVFRVEPLELIFMNLDDDTYPHSKGNEYHKIF